MPWFGPRWAKPEARLSHALDAARVGPTCIAAACGRPQESDAVQTNSRTCLDWLMLKSSASCLRSSGMWLSVPLLPNLSFWPANVFSSSLASNLFSFPLELRQNHRSWNKRIQRRSSKFVTAQVPSVVQEVPQKETTPFYPRSPYAVAKLYAYWIARGSDSPAKLCRSRRAGVAVGTARTKVRDQEKTVR